MKIAIITLVGHFNYGNRLQNYALQKFISNYAEITETLWYEENYLPKIKRNKLDKMYLKNILKFILNWKGAREKEGIYVEECIRQYNIKKFSDKYINIKHINKIDEKINDIYDYFIVGSDQIWNPYYIGHFKEKFLQFASFEKRIAYAASFGITNIPIEKKMFFKKALLNMRKISVRENEGKKIIKDLIDREVPVLVDPTLILKKEEWQKIEMVPEWYNGEKYILTYFIGKPSSIIKDIVKKNNWKIYNLMDKNNFKLYTSRVEEFVYLIDHAELVITDSFHASVFSILMNTPFLVVNRQIKGEADMTSRINTLMKLFGYQDRYIINGKCDLSDKDILNMDFSNVKTIQEREKKRSKDFLEKALNLKVSDR